MTSLEKLKSCVSRLIGLLFGLADVLHSALVDLFDYIINRKTKECRDEERKSQEVKERGCSEEVFVEDSDGELKDHHNLEEIALIGPLICIIKKMNKKYRNKERKSQEVKEREFSEEVTRKFVEDSDGELKDHHNLEEIGSCLQKSWYEVVTSKISLEKPKRILECCVSRLIWLLLGLAGVLHSALIGLLDYILKGGRDKERKSQEVKERGCSDEVTGKFVEDSDGELKDHHNLKEIGSRLQKLWYEVVASKKGERGKGKKKEEDKEEEGEGDRKVLTVAPVSVNCPLKLDQKMLKTLNSLLHALRHPLLHPIDKVHYDSQSGHVVMVQPLMSRGSLKDLIYGASALNDWSIKYSRYSNSPLTSDKVACYGRQILEAIIFLYEQGFPPLGHIQTGNIFVDGDVCRLGGYENMLLGYRPRLYRLCKTFNCTKDIDIITFGYVIFEMACGYELTHLVPGEGEYRSVNDQVLQDVLQVIFHQDEEGRFTSSIKEILALDFFQEADLPHPKEVSPDSTSLTRDMKHLLSKVVKGKGRIQVTTSKQENKPCRVQ